MLDILMNNKAVIIAALLAISEVLALIPSVKSNSIFEVVVKVIGNFVPKAPAEGMKPVDPPTV